MITHLVCTAALLLGATALRADVFSFNYAGPGNLYTQGKISANALSGGLYQVTDVYDATRNGQTIGNGVLFGDSGLFYYDGGLSPYLAGGAITYGQGLIGKYILAYVDTPFGGYYTETSLTNGIVKLNSFNITAVPEGSALLLLLTSVIGVFVLARKLPSKKRLLR